MSRGVCASLFLCVCDCVKCKERKKKEYCAMTDEEKDSDKSCWCCFFFFLKSFLQLLNRFEEAAGKRRDCRSCFAVWWKRGIFFFSSWEEAREVQDCSFLQLCFGKVSSWIIQTSLICHFCFINKPPMISGGLPVSETWTQHPNFSDILPHKRLCVCVVFVFACFPACLSTPRTLYETKSPRTLWIQRRSHVKNSSRVWIFFFFF